METEFIDWLKQRLPPHEQLLLGVGDDAAILRLRGDCVATTDMLMDGVDFEVGKCDPRRIGRKALAVNLSDLAAMGCQPVAALIALSLPQHGGRTLALELYEGLLPLARQFNVAIAGGDTNSWPGPLVVSVTALGQCDADTPPWPRSGARPGDRIVVSGDLGGSILGKHFDFQPRIDLARDLRHDHNCTVRAAADVSDGLALDLFRMSLASRCAAVIRPDALPVSQAARTLATDQSLPRSWSWGDSQDPADRAVGHALFDGEDFELLLALSPKDAKRLCAEAADDAPLTDIGFFDAGRDLWTEDANGFRRQLEPDGFVHQFD